MTNPEWNKQTAQQLPLNLVLVGTGSGSEGCARRTAIDDTMKNLLKPSGIPTEKSTCPPPQAHAKLTA
eukprot:1926188-Amphidinium_carterae.1